MANHDDMHVFSPLQIKIDAKTVQRVLVGMNCTFIFIRASDESITDNLIKCLTSEKLSDVTILTQQHK